MMNYFSFRAECVLDIDRFIREFRLEYPRSYPLCGEGPFAFNSITVYDQDLKVEFYSGCTLNAVKKVMEIIADSHVMIETLRPVPLAENSLEREYQAQWRNHATTR
jgi:hypothetical protein